MDMRCLQLSASTAFLATSAGGFVLPRYALDEIAEVRPDVTAKLFPIAYE